MTRLVKFGAAAMCTLTVVVSCSKQSSSPSAPSSVNQASAEANADGSKLKVSAPTVLSPINNVTLVQDTLAVLAISNSALTFASEAALTYRFELFNAGGTILFTAPSVAAGAGTTSVTVPLELEVDRPFTWRARPESGGEVGPWSATASFRTPEPTGYLRGAELYDPLTHGKTIGTIVGPVTFIPGVGVRLDTFGSHIVYELPQPLEDGELSALVTGVATNTEGGKTKIFSMAEGYSDLTTNPRRMTVEKRGDAPTGGIAWRFLTNAGDGVDTVGAERVVREFNPSLTYFWEADWRDGHFNVLINEGGVSGRNIYNFGKHYEGFYRPEPHVVYLGGGPARGGLESQTVPGMIIRQVWVSQRPRPPFANK